MEAKKKAARKELTERLYAKLNTSEKTAVSKEKAGELLNAVVDVIAESLLDGQTVGLAGFGTFRVKEDAARNGVLPGTSEKIEIPAIKRVKFKAADQLADKIKNA